MLYSTLGVCAVLAFVSSTLISLASTEWGCHLFTRFRCACFLKLRGPARAVSSYSNCPLARGTPQICIFKTSPTSGSPTLYTEFVHEVLPFFPHPQYYLSKKIRSRKLERWRTQKNEGESSLNDAPPRNSTINYHGGRQKNELPVGLLRDRRR